MTPRQYARAFARGWWLVILLVLVGTLLGQALNATVVPAYTSSSSILVSPTGAASATSSEAYNANLLAQGRVQSYAELATEDAVTESVVEELELDLTATELGELIEVDVPSQTSVLAVSVSAEDPDDSMSRTNAVANRLVTLVTRGERRRGSGTALLRAEVQSMAVVATEEARVPQTRNPILGGVAGLLLGLAVAVVAGRLDRRLREDDDVAETLGAPVVGALPPTGRRGADSKAVLTAVRALRTTVFFRHPDSDGSLSLALTSPHRVADLPQVAVALATSLVGTGHRVLLVEADLREPAIADLLELDGDKTTGLGPYLEGSHDQGEVVHHHAASGLDVVLAGRVVEDSADLLHSRAFGELLTDAAHRYDHVVVTTPPTDAGTDAAAVAAQCDTTAVLVVRKRTRKPQLRDTAEQLARVDAEVFGAVVLG